MWPPAVTGESPGRLIGQLKGEIPLIVAVRSEFVRSALARNRGSNTSGSRSGRHNPNSTSGSLVQLGGSPVTPAGSPRPQCVGSPMLVSARRESAVAIGDRTGSGTRHRDLVDLLTRLDAGSEPRAPMTPLPADSIWDEIGVVGQAGDGLRVRCPIWTETGRSGLAIEIIVDPEPGSGWNGIVSACLKVRRQATGGVTL
jgi:hypothetical protein